MIKIKLVNSNKLTIWLIIALTATLLFSNLNIREALSAAETKWADSHIIGDITNPNNALGATNGTWAGDVNANVSAASRYSMENPSGGLSGTQTINVVARKGSNSGTPTVAVGLYDNGALVQGIVAATSITSTTGQTLSGTFDGAIITAGSDVQIEIIITGAGGSPSARNSAQIDSIEWAVQYSAASTTLSTGTNPGDSTIAPGGAITSVNGFTLTTNTGTDAITSITVNLSTNSGVGTLTITDGADAVLGSIGGGTGAGIVTGSNAISITSTNATTGGTAFKVKVTPLSHANMPVPDGGAYAITGVVTDWAGDNTKAGQANDTSSTVTIDNDSPTGTTGAGATSGENAQSVVSWTNPGDGDFQQVYIYCKTSSLLSGEAPTEGTDPAAGSTCDGTARLRYKGTASPQTITSLTNGQIYYFRIYARDTNGNFTAYSTTQEASATPTAPAAPDATSYTNTETALNNLGGRIGQQITVSGTNLAGGGSVTAKDTCVAGANNGCVRVANYTIPAANITTWNNTTIIFTIPSGITVYGGSGTTCGGADGNGICVTQNGNNDTGGALEFWVYPDITSTTPSAATGAREGDSVTITGNRFGTATGTVDFINCTGINSASTTLWADTSIAVTVPSTITDTDDSCDVQVTRAAGTGSKTDTSNNSADNLGTFVILPDITGIIDDFGGADDTAREYDASDSAANNTIADLKDGEIQIDGKHFGGAGTVTILGQTAAQAVVGTRCGGSSYTATCITVQISTTTSDSLYTGNVVVQRSDSKSDSLSGFRVLPRIIDFTPGSAAISESVTVNGNHFCQNGGVCPSAFGAADNYVIFNSNATATSFVSWNDTAMVTAVPTGASTGNVFLRSNGYNSNANSFTVNVPTPANPSNLWQARNSAFTNLIATGGVASSTPVYLSATTSSGVGGGTMYMQTEMRPITGGNSTFSSTSTCSSVACTSLNPYCFESAGASYPTGGASLTATSSITLTDEFYHWQTRIRYNKTGTDYCSTWQCYPDSGCNSEVTTDFEIDTVAPAVSGENANTSATSSATITWTTDELATSQVEYGTDPGLAGSSFTPLNSNLELTPHSTTLTNLTCGTIYYRARSKDSGGLEGISSSIKSFSITCPTQPAKTTSFYIVGATGSIVGGSTATTTFAVSMPETASTTKSAFVEITGVYASGASSKDIAVQVNSQAARTYVVPASTTSFFKFIYQVDSVNPSNTLVITPQANTAVYITSAKIIINYAYTP